MPFLLFNSSFKMVLASLYKKKRGEWGRRKRGRKKGGKERQRKGRERDVTS